MKKKGLKRLARGLGQHWKSETSGSLVLYNLWGECDGLLVEEWTQQERMLTVVLLLTRCPFTIHLNIKTNFSFQQYQHRRNLLFPFPQQAVFDQFMGKELTFPLVSFNILYFLQMTGNGAAKQGVPQGL